MSTSFYYNAVDNTTITDVIRVHHEDKHKWFEDILASASDHESKTHKLRGEDQQKLGCCYIQKYQPNDEGDDGHDSGYKFVHLSNCCFRVVQWMS